MRDEGDAGQGSRVTTALPAKVEAEENRMKRRGVAHPLPASSDSVPYSLCTHARIRRIFRESRDTHC